MSGMDKQTLSPLRTAMDKFNTGGCIGFTLDTLDIDGSELRRVTYTMRKSNDVVEYYPVIRDGTTCP